MNLFTHTSCSILQKVKCCVCFSKSFSTCMSLYTSMLLGTHINQDATNEGKNWSCLVWDVPNQCGQELIPVMGSLRGEFISSHPFGHTWWALALPFSDWPEIDQMFVTNFHYSLLQKSLVGVTRDHSENSALWFWGCSILQGQNILNITGSCRFWGSTRWNKFCTHGGTCR